MRLLLLTTLFVLGLVVTTEAQAQVQAQAPQPKRPSSFYAFEGVTYSNFRGELRALASEAVQVQIGLGYQPENSLWAYELMGRGGVTLDGNSGLMGWGLRAKRLVPLRKHFNLYARVGVTENFLTTRGPDLAGFGLEYGAGAMATIRVRALGLLFAPAFFMGVGPKVNLSLWADFGGEVGNLHSYHTSSSESPSKSYGYNSTTGSYGLIIGGHF